MKRGHIVVVGLLLGGGWAGETFGQRIALLRDVRMIQVERTVVPNPAKVKEDFGPNLVEDALRNALRNANFEIADEAAIKAYIQLDEFSSGNVAKRFLVGMGAGRSTVAGRLIFTDADDKELAN